MRHIAGILLAAGSGTRFGSHKLLAPLPDGKLLGIAAAGTMMRVLPRVLAVVRPGDAELSQRLEEEWVEVVECARAADGMGSSLACGIAASRDADAWLVALADMPHIKESTFRRVLQALTGGAGLAAPVYRGQRGHPVGFSAAFRPALLALTGDRGARDLLAAAARDAVWIDVDDPGVLVDIDVPEDLRGAPTS